MLFTFANTTVAKLKKKKKKKPMNNIKDNPLCLPSYSSPLPQSKAKGGFKLIEPNR